MKNFPACILLSATPTAAKPTPIGNHERTSTCSRVTATCGLTTTRLSARVTTNWTTWASAESRSKQLRKVLAHFVFPERPIVAALRAPVVHRMTDPFARQHFRQTVARPAVLPRSRSGDEVDVAGSQLLVVPRVG